METKLHCLANTTLGVEEGVVISLLMDPPRKTFGISQTQSDLSILVGGPRNLTSPPVVLIPRLSPESVPVPLERCQEEI